MTTQSEFQASVIEKLAHIEEKVDRINGSVKDHEERIRDVEKAQGLSNRDLMKIVGILGAIVAPGSIEAIQQILGG